MEIVPVTKDNRDKAICLLQRASLPIADIGENVQLFAMQNDDEIVGIIGFETDGKTVLLRSLSIDETQRSKTLGSILVDHLENFVRQKGNKTIYLLTTTAALFFSKRGYAIIARQEVPAFIQQTTEFASVCPASATIMKKELL